MDIQGLVNHTDYEDKRSNSSTPPNSSPPESARSQIPNSLTRQCHSPYHLPSQAPQETYSSKYQPPVSNDQRDPAAGKRGIALLSTLPAKRRNGEAGENGRIRRRALQACETCRSKKSKCDNERPSCGSCIQHGAECIYKGAPFIPV